MSIRTKIRTVFRGDISFGILVREALRRRKMAARRSAERRSIDEIGTSPARLLPEFEAMTPSDLLEHFRQRNDALLITKGIEEAARSSFPAETKTLIAAADRIVDESVWELAGFGALEFKGDNCWRRDPLGTKDWGLDYHADVVLFSGNGADIRVLWELNRFGHAVTLACAFAVTKDERYAEAFFAQVEAWMRQDPYGRGANWQCAMEVALRAINLLAAFDILRRSKACSHDRLAMMLQLFDQHGRFTLDNNEFSYLATSNHYLSDVVGLFWIGAFLPELEHAAEWRELGLSATLHEMDKQILPDGADFEASTGYHKFVAEMLLFTFLLAQKNGIEIADGYWQKLRSMFDYIYGIIRSDGRVPLIGDADGSQIVPLVKRDSDDQSYLLAVAAVVFEEPKFAEFAERSPELLWLIARDAAEKSDSPPQNGSVSFPNAGSYVLRDGDLYLHFNTNDTGTNGRGSHAHNDALSIEVAAFGRAFIVDPGSCVYNLDREARHLFRSTAVHSTIVIDGEEQNKTLVDLPFVLGNEAKPKVLEWKTTTERDLVSAEHYGYSGLSDPTIHRRTIEFDRREKYWAITDELGGKGTHDITLSYHLAPGVSADSAGDAIRLVDADGRCLLIRITGIGAQFDLVPAAVSRNYGHREDSTLLRLRSSDVLPLTIRSIIVPAAPGENLDDRLELLARLADNTDS